MKDITIIMKSGFRVLIKDGNKQEVLGDIQGSFSGFISVHGLILNNSNLPIIEEDEEILVSINNILTIN